ncbi:MAG: hypothetical protein GWN07_17540, partial [Actinobacteria bacterium]|nr:hypothetical protein [Actinomycetota bacterium]
MPAALLALGVTVAGAAACSSDGPEQTLRAFLDGWPTGELAGVTFVSPTGTPVGSGEVATQ